MNFCSNLSVIHLKLDELEKVLGTENIKGLRLKQISSIIQERIAKLQNPSELECIEANKIVCRPEFAFGSAPGFDEIL